MLPNAYNLCIDFGNSRTKYAVFEKQQLLYEAAVELFTVKEVKKLFIKYPQINNCIISSVIKMPKPLLSFLERKCQVNFLSTENALPIKIKYATPQTLGADRIAVSCGAKTLFPKKNILVINCGTCITYDFINSKNEYLGGSISLGIEMRFNALHHFTQKLPKIKKQNIDTLIGNNTETSILSGVINGTIAELNGIIKKYETKYSTLQCVLTGGDADFLAKHIKSNIFVAPHLTLVGLNTIINFIQKH